MSKKLLNESTIRRFAGLAGIGADVVSNFINEAYGEDEDKMEEEVVSEEETISEEEEAEEEAEEDMDDMMDMDAEAEEGAEEEADMDMEMDMDAEDEGGEDAEALVSDIVAKLQDLAKMAGVDIDVEMGDEEDDLEEGYGATSAAAGKRDEDAMMEEGEETLEEIINGILDEETEGLEEASCGSDDKMEEAEELEEGSKTQVQEEVVQEVLRRVRERLAQKTEQ
jgi:hypothetical protein